MQEVIFIIGLPGSGKTTLVKYYKSHPFINYKIYDDWMTWTHNGQDKDFIADVNYKELLETLNQGTSTIITSLDFCNSEFLQKSENYLKSIFPNLKINKIYFENDPIKSEANIKYRDEVNGGKWKKNEKGETFYSGTIFELKPLYLLEIKKTLRLTLDYVIPEGSTIFPIIVQE